MRGAEDHPPPSFSSAGPTPRRSIRMLYTIAVILLVAWLLGIVGPYTIGAFVHVLLVVAIVLFLVGLVNGRRTLTLEPRIGHQGRTRPDGTTIGHRMMS